MTLPAQSPSSRHYAVIGGGMAGVACARTLAQAGHRVTLLEKSAGLGGRMSTRRSEFGGFDHGAQYFTVRDSRFAQALQTVPGLCKAWSASTVRVLDTFGQVAAAGLPNREPHWVPVPGMNALVRRWAEPLRAPHQVLLDTRVTAIAPDSLHPKRWQLRTESGSAAAPQVLAGFDAVLLALPHAQAHGLLAASNLVPKLAHAISAVEVAPCWTLMLAFPQAVQPTLPHLGPQWNAARSTHHRIAWLARESSKPGRNGVERWTVQASAAWSLEHLEDNAPRVQGKLLKAFAEVTGIRAQPQHAVVHRWRYAQTVKPLGKSHLWDAKARIGVAGDWCLGHRVEDAFVSGLELALAAL
ncbi:MAG TPA: FAD-dependent oxidoreductase [Burkholderiaceae bacterium]